MPGHSRTVLFDTSAGVDIRTKSIIYKLLLTNILFSKKKSSKNILCLKKILVLSKVCGCNAVLSRAGRRAGGGWCGSAHVRHHSVSSRPGGGSLGCAARCCCCWPHSSLSFCSVVPPPPRHAAPPATTSHHSDNIGHLLQRRRGVTAATE